MGKRGVKPKIEAPSSNLGRPIPPRGLDKVAKAAWDSLCDDLQANGTLHTTDRKLLELYSTTFALWKRISDQLPDELTTGPPDRKFIHPLVSMFNTYSQRLHRLLLDFGLSPTTRKEGKAHGDNPWSEIGRMEI